MMILIAAILGLTIFELLFEARARYLYCYAPVYAILGVLGLRQLFWRLSVGFNDTERKQQNDSIQSGTGPVDRDSLLQ
jgi:ABC-type Na+ efflux pump permease subunit